MFLVFDVSIMTWSHFVGFSCIVGSQPRIRVFEIFSFPSSKSCLLVIHNELEDLRSSYTFLFRSSFLTLPTLHYLRREEDRESKPLYEERFMLRKAHSITLLLFVLRPQLLRHLVIMVLPDIDSRACSGSS
jgi:hypothetical protein